MRLVADPLDQQEGGVVFRQPDRFFTVAGEEQLFLLGDADSDQVGEADLLERFVGG